MYRHYLIFVLTFISINYNTKGQSSQDSLSWFSRHPIEISTGNAAIGLPFQPFLSPVYHPTVQVGLQYDLTSFSNFKVNTASTIGFTYHRYQGHYYSLGQSLRLKYISPIKLYAQLGLKVGFMAHQYPQEVFTLSSSGDYEVNRSWQVKGKMYTGLSFELGYFFPSKNSSLFVQHHSGIGFIHHPEIPVFPYSSTQLGIRFTLSTK